MSQIAETIARELAVTRRTRRARVRRGTRRSRRARRTRRTVVTALAAFAAVAALAALPSLIVVVAMRLATWREPLDFCHFIGKRVIVHCVHAQERSPLAVAWYLAWSRSVTIEVAHGIVAKKHPTTENRLKWVRGLVPCRQPVLNAVSMNTPR